jgi:protein-tyrosine phosphatase
MEESLEMARIAERDGVEKIVATPHLFRGNFIHDDLSIIEKKRSELSQALEENNILVEILAGAEVHISHNLIDEIRKNRENLVLSQSSYMFVEFPSELVFSGAKSLFFELMSEGIKPIIAHPERNSVFIHNPSLLYELLQMGALSQANSGSLSGLYGRRVEEAVLYFLELNFIHFIASDSHHTHSALSRLSQAVKRVGMIIGEEKAQALVEDNPRAVLDDKRIPYLPEPIDPQEKEKSLKIRVPKIFRRRKGKRHMKYME